MFQGFMIEEDKQIRSLQEHCQHVFIDVKKGLQTPNDNASGPPPLPADFPPAPIPKPRVTYENKTEVEEELEVAKETRTALTELVGGFLDDIGPGKARFNRRQRDCL
jgi:hypothetical protein